MDPSRAAALVGLHVATAGRAGARLLGSLESAAGPLESWWFRRDVAFSPPAGCAPALVAALLDRAVDAAAARAEDALRRAGFVVDGAEDWPPLRALPDPPAALFRKGRAFAAGAALAVVGARAATAYGRRATRLFAGAAAQAGACVVSGLARGVDAEAHRAALDVGGSTVAVLGCGPDRAYPPENAELQERIGAEGALLTEHLPGVPPLARHFPRRNRILAALADAALLVEARIKSGSLTTVRWAADLGRDVLVVPGPYDAPLSEGPLELLREGATPVYAVEHVLEALGLSTEIARPPTPSAGGEDGAADDERDVSPSEERLLALVRGAPTDLDDLVRLSGEPPSRVLTAVLALETRGLLRRGEDGRSFTAD